MTITDESFVKAMTKESRSLLGGQSGKSLALGNESHNGKPDENLCVGSSNLPALTNLPATATPPFLAEIMCGIACIKEQSRVLEPSAGYGILALAARNRGANVTCVELNEDCVDHLRSKNFIVYHHDFLTFDSGSPMPFDAIVMCPPQNSIPHIDHALKFLKHDGTLVALVRRDSKYIEKYIDKYNPLPYNMFVMDGEPVDTGLIVLKKEH